VDFWFKVNSEQTRFVGACTVNYLLAAGLLFNLSKDHSAFGAAA